MREKHLNETYEGFNCQPDTCIVIQSSGPCCRRCMCIVKGAIAAGALSTLFTAGAPQLATCISCRLMTMKHTTPLNYQATCRVKNMGCFRVISDTKWWHLPRALVTLPRMNRFNDEMRSHNGDTGDAAAGRRQLVSSGLAGSTACSPACGTMLTR